LKDKISPVVAAAILEQASGNQAVILRELFDSQGLLKHKEVKKVFEEKVKTAKTALDRVEKINTEIDKEVQTILEKAKSEKRKQDMGDIGKIFLHIDISSSMENALEVAKNYGSTIAECVQNPEENFKWGLFNERGGILNIPKTFEKAAFQHALYGIRAGGMTDCMALWGASRQAGCDVDVFITDQDHNGRSITNEVIKWDQKGFSRPKSVVIVKVGVYQGELVRELEQIGIPVVYLDPSALTESALVVQAIKSALLGKEAIINEIMDTPLLRLPEWWETV